MTKSKTNNLINGVAADYLNINDRAIHYGDGIFETVLCHHHKLYYWAQHYQRLRCSAEKLNIPCPDENLLLDDIFQLLRSAKTPAAKLDENAYAIKIILTRGVGERGYKYTKVISPNRIVSCSTLEASYSSLISGNLIAGDLFLCEHQASINENLAGIKHLNRLENVLARNEWNDSAAAPQYIDGLMLNANQYVIEGTMSNVFAVKDNQLFTPDLMQSGVDGVIRNIVMAIAAHSGIPLSIVNLPLNKILIMDEVFISNSLIGIKAVTNFLNVSYSSDRITSIIFSNLLSSVNEHAQSF